MHNPVYRIRRDGQGCGGFLCPPGHPNHYYVVYGYFPRGDAAVTPSLRRNGPDSIGALDSVISNEYGDMPESLIAQAKRIMDSAELVYSERWVRSVYGYFKNMYAPESGSRNVSDATAYRPGSDPGNPAPRPPATRHLAYLCVREYFPAHTPREDLITDPGRGYGSYPCDKCGERVQYEARNDAWCVVSSGNWTYNTDCPEGGRHSVATYPAQS